MSTTREPFRWHLAAAWAGLCVGNAVLPWILASVFEPESRIGHVAGIAVWAVVGGWACGARPRLGWRLRNGALLLMLGQATLVPTILAGCLAVPLVAGGCGLVGLDPSPNLSNFLMTVATGGILIAMASVLGGFAVVGRRLAAGDADQVRPTDAAAIARQQGQWTGEALFD